MNYLLAEYPETDPEKQEILIAFLSEIGFETFEETPDGLKAYIPESYFNKTEFETVTAGRWPVEDWKFSSLPQQNWNEVWEKNFHPVMIEGVHIRAPFHPPVTDARIELVIEPKMSFGTGHHPTTSLMVRQLLKTDLKGKSVLDMGCGTAVLAILAAKLGAEKIQAIDIEDWAVENSIENCNRNQAGHVRVMKGNASAIGSDRFDIILANINLNVLLIDMPAYARALNPGGSILLSGFYETDLNEIKNGLRNAGLEFDSCDVQEKWAMARGREM